MSTTTTNYGLIKPDTTDPILVGQLNDNADVIDATLKSLSDALDVAKLGIKYKGEVNYYSNLPSSGNQIGDAYTVKYAGSSGTTPDGTEYVWGTVSGTNQWINFSKDSYTKAEVDALLALKQNALSSTQLDAVNSGIDSTKVAQIETNKNNIADIKDGTSINSFGDVETALATKANTSTTYTKTEVDTALSAKADKSTTYTKTEVDTALADKVDKETGKGLSTNDYTTAEKTKLAGIAEGAEVNVQSNWTQTTTTADDYIKNKPTLGTAAAKNATDTYNATGTDVTTGKAVAAALATLPEPMVFKGSLGTGGTITTLPSASSSNKGYVYKVITAGTYASQSAKAGDTFISDGSAWVLIPSGDEPSGTVTNVAVANGGGLTVSGSPITSSGTITVGHSNSVTAKTSSSLKKFTYDAYGHVTGSSELSTAESNALASGIDSTKVEQIESNKNNILLLEQMDGAKNKFNYEAWKNCGVYHGTKTVNGNSFTIVANGDDCYTFYQGYEETEQIQYPINARIPCNAGDKVVLTWDYIPLSSQTNDRVGIFANGSVNTGFFALTLASDKKLEFTAPTGTIYLSIRFGVQVSGNSATYGNIQIQSKASYDAGFTDYQPYAMSNAELTAAIQVLQAQLANQ